ncbi:hypothetical protein BST95_08990 [Halioglobus japonicus]|uniref:Restriction endonuclease subunit S n=1 Tax=Halioglobus japonicus TaxID=930805 RepID=A0AAP8MEU2_9GAMM|nr:restriction endonuclease subunit S [Halioglobus japonicus]AQA18346.1 hypothetical protein BST95_08990 [Halioglobus japonicus]PLW86364.1 restriction endonuclease subunit S [Halioglobus japonicus]GHD13258.1 type I restriction endonuclease subunit S [Halioglobus japonicus]
MSNPYPVTTLGEVFEIARGGSPRPIKDYITEDPAGLNWISIKDASNGGKYISETKQKIRKEGLSKSRLVKPGDFLLTNSMSFGRPYIMNTTGCIHDGWLVLSSDPEKVFPDYFYYLLGSETMYRKFSALAGGAVVKNLNIDLVKGVEIPLPPLKEQKRIAAILDKTDAIRRKRRQVIQLAEEFLRAVFLDMFGDPVTNSKGWDTLGLSKVIESERGISYGVVQRGDQDNDGVRLVRISDFTENLFNPKGVIKCSQEISDQYKRTVLKGGELLISIRGTVGRIAVVPDYAVGWNVTREVAIIPLLEGESRAFIRSLLLTGPAQRLISGQVKGVAQSGINLADLREFELIRPPENMIKRYERIEAFVMDKFVSYADEKDYDALFFSLSQTLFAGEL